MSAIARSPRYVVLCLALLGLACSDAPTASDSIATGETLVLSVVGVAADDAGIVLRLSGAIQTVEATRPSLEIAWAADNAGGTTIVIIGALSESSDLALVSRRTAPEPLRAEVIEVAGAEGALSQPSLVRATARPLVSN